MDDLKIPEYPETMEVGMELRSALHPLFKALGEGVSEFSFANIYLFRAAHNYSITRLKESGLLMITGEDKGGRFFMLPFGLPGKAVLDELFKRFSFMKCVPESYAEALRNLGYRLEEDRDNFDYLYIRKELSKLEGRRFHRKKNLVNFFTGRYSYVGKPLLNEYINDALFILDEWVKGKEVPGDYDAAKEGLLKCDGLKLCGAIYYVEEKPAAYVLGEELGSGAFAIHFEKGIGEYKGLLQFVNQSFSSLLPEKYEIINREQDLGDQGLRKAKMSYRPSGFIKKYRVYSR